MLISRRGILLGAAAAPMLLSSCSKAGNDAASPAAAAPEQKFKVGVVPNPAKAEAALDAAFFEERKRNPIKGPKTAEEKQLEMDAQAGGVSVPVTMLSPEQRAERFWLRCDEVGALGFRRIETDDTFARNGAYFSTRLDELRDGLAKRNMSISTLTWFVHMANAAKVAEISNDCLASARSVQAGNGKYVGILVSAGPEIGYSTEAQYKAVDAKAVGAAMNEIGKRIHGETGVKILYHPLSEEFNVGLPARLMQETDPALVDLTMDLGHLGSSNVGATKEAMLQACRDFYSRTGTVHIKDVKRPGRHGNAELGKGDVDLKGLIDFYKTQGFAGLMMTEGGGSHDYSRAYLVDQLGLSLT